MAEIRVKEWFGEEFDKLDPLLQRLHINGGHLEGEVDIAYGKGLAGSIGRRLAVKMKLPHKGAHRLAIDISHSPAGLHWNRTFDRDQRVDSLFEPVGKIGRGRWIETTGPLTMRLTVDIVNGGWHWRCLGIRFLGVPIPALLVPKTIAYKRIENGKYRFHVEFTLPLVGSLVSYSGLLSLIPIRRSV